MTRKVLGKNVARPRPSGSHRVCNPGNRFQRPHSRRWPHPGPF
jgi:hypothetical protein